MQSKRTTERIYKPAGSKSKSTTAANPGRLRLRGSITDLTLKNIVGALTEKQPDLDPEVALEMAKQIRAEMQREGTAVWKPEYPNRKQRRAMLCKLRSNRS